MKRFFSIMDFVGTARRARFRISREYRKRDALLHVAPPRGLEWLYFWFLYFASGEDDERLVLAALVAINFGLAFAIWLF